MEESSGQRLTQPDGTGSHGSLTERALVAIAVDDASAFTELYRRYADRVYRYILTRGVTSVDAADLTQQVFLRCLEALPRYEERGIPFAAWLFQIARHAATDAYRRNRRLIPWSHDLNDRRNPAPGPEDIVLRSDEYRHIRELVARLDQNKQELLALRFAAGLTSPEIAALLGKSPAAVQRQLHRIVQSLREQYDEPAI